MIEVLMRVYLKPELMKPEHPSANEMANRMKQFEKESHKKELEQFRNREASQPPLLSDWRENIAARWGLLKRSLLIFFKDLDRFIDFLLALYIVRRETRRDKKGDGKE